MAASPSDLSDRLGGLVYTLNSVPAVGDTIYWRGTEPCAVGIESVTKISDTEYRINNYYLLTRTSAEDTNDYTAPTAANVDTGK